MRETVRKDGIARLPAAAERPPARQPIGAEVHRPGAAPVTPARVLTDTEPATVLSVVDARLLIPARRPAAAPVVHKEPEVTGSAAEIVGQIIAVAVRAAEARLIPLPDAPISVVPGSGLHAAVVAVVRPEIEGPVKGPRAAPTGRCARLREDVARVAVTPRGQAMDPLAVVATEDGVLGPGPDATSTRPPRPGIGPARPAPVTTPWRRA